MPEGNSNNSGNNNGGIIALATAGISAASLITVALLNRPAGKAETATNASAAAEPAKSAEPAAPTGSDGATGPLHKIVVDNTCTHPFSIMFYFHGKKGWTSANGASWDYAPRESFSPNDDDDVPLATDRDEIYVRGINKIDGAAMWDDSVSVDVDGKPLGFTKAKVKALDSGEYQVALACD